MQSTAPNRYLHDAAAPAGFTPAFPLLGLYDPVVRWLSRDRAWRSALLDRLAPRAGELIVDAGCGTGTFLAEVGRHAPRAELIGMDPDMRVLQRAGGKLAAAGVAADLQQGYLHDIAGLLEGRVAAKISCSLVFHQVPLAGKRAGLAAMYDALAPGGTLLIADYGLQRTAAMRALFRLVQIVDGFADTQPNADGVLPALMREAGFVDVEETDLFATATGSVSIYRATRQTKAALLR
ncbi:class I SAM-dependent methyltransferase [Sphingomonas koreensis]